MGKLLPLNARPYALGFCLAVLMGITFARSVLVGDEVFVMWASVRELAASPDAIWTGAIDAARGGWEMGRFTSPLLHLLSNAGVVLAHVSGEGLGLTILESMSVWRVLMFALTVLGVVWVIQAMTLPIAGSRTAVLAMTSAAVAVPAAMPVTWEWGSPRMGTWSYGVAFVLTLAVTGSILWLSWRLRTSSTGAVGVARTLIGLSGGIFFGTTYELTQVLFIPFLMTMYFQQLLGLEQRIVGANVQRRTWAFFKDPLVLGSLVSYVLSLLILRMNAMSRCANGCYGPADIRPEAFDAQVAVIRALSSLPVVPWLRSRGSVLELTTSWPFLLLALVIGVIFAWCFVKFVAAPTLAEARKDREVAIGGMLIALGSVIIVLISIGMALSRDAQMTEHFWSWLGKSSRDTLYVNVGFGILLSGVAVVALASNVFWPLHRRKTWLAKRSPIALSSAMVGAIAALSSHTNLTSSDEILSSQTFRLQSVFSQELRSFDFSAEGMARRCALVIEKLERYPEWENHDRILVYGLNLAAQEEYDVEFCSRSVDELFELHYPLLADNS